MFDPRSWRVRPVDSGHLDPLGNRHGGRGLSPLWRPRPWRQLASRLEVPPMEMEVSTLNVLLKKIVRALKPWAPVLGGLLHLIASVITLAGVHGWL